jgi:hypothetical protein
MVGQYSIIATSMTENWFRIGSEQKGAEYPIFKPIGRLDAIAGLPV